MDSQKQGRIKLVTFALYAVRGKPGYPGAKIEVLCGAEDARFAGEHVELLAGSCPFRSKLLMEYAPPRRSGALMLYGRRDALEELQHWRSEARRRNAHFASAEVEVDVGRIHPGIVSRAHLQAEGNQIRFVNFKRITASLQQEVLVAFQDYVRKEGGDPDVAMAKVHQIAERPDLFARLLSDDPDFRRLSVIVIPVADDPDSPARTRQMAFVKAGARITSVAQGTGEATFFMPAWLTD